jgi:DNA/RNA endonuclease YhcR with UshA esterase domain
VRKSIKSLACSILLILAFVICASSSVAQREYVNAIDARKYVGMQKTVCGIVASATYAIRSRGKPTFLNLDQAYPDEIFTVVIWGSERNKFKNPPEIYFKGKRICVTGIIDTYRGKPQIVVHGPDQITIESP